VEEEYSEALRRTPKSMEHYVLIYEEDRAYSGDSIESCPDLRLLSWARTRCRCTVRHTSYIAHGLRSSKPHRCLKYVRTTLLHTVSCIHSIRVCDNPGNDIANFAANGILCFLGE